MNMISKSLVPAVFGRWPMTHGSLNPAPLKRARNRPAMCALVPGVSEVTKSLPLFFLLFAPSSTCHCVCASVCECCSFFRHASRSCLENCQGHGGGNRSLCLLPLLHLACWYACLYVSKSSPGGQFWASFFFAKTRPQTPKTRSQNGLALRARNGLVFRAPLIFL